MTTIGVHHYRLVSAMILLSAAVLHLHAQPAKGESFKRSIRPVLVNTCIVTEDVKRLVGFYEPILGQKAKWSGDDYAEFATGVAVLAIFSYSAQQRYIPQSAAAGRNRSVILEFKVVDVDAEYRRLKGIVKMWVKPPTTQPWGTRSIYFRDPDGNLVDVYSPVSASPGGTRKGL
jgi:catechol 2,3-dioxygenase-like lactoylglutathione lyase family enzyme